MKLHHVAVVCRSAENADRFYQVLLGLEKIKEFSLDEDLKEKIFGKAPLREIRLYGNEQFRVEVFLAERAPGKDPVFEHLCLEVKEREEFVSACERVRLPVKRILRGDSLLVFVEDFDGNLFEVKQAPPD